MPIDTTKSLEIRLSPLKYLRLGLGGALLTGVCLAEASGDIPVGSMFPGEFWGYANPLWWVVVFGVLFFGGATLTIFWRALTVRRPVIVLSPERLLDYRIASTPIPWTAIRRISTWSFRRSNAMVLQIDPEVEAKLPLTRTIRWTSGANAWLGADGLCVMATGLQLTYSDLLDATTANLKAAHPDAG